MTVISLRVRPRGRLIWDLAILPVLGVLYVLQLIIGVTMLTSPNHPSSIKFQALLLLLFFVIAILRA
jgi:hypothetical protein